MLQRTHVALLTIECKCWV